MHRRRCLTWLGLMPLGTLTPLLPRATPAAWAADAPALLLANLYRPGMRLADYWVSEKYDGVRRLWPSQ